MRGWVLGVLIAVEGAFLCSLGGGWVLLSGLALGYLRSRVHFLAPLVVVVLPCRRVGVLIAVEGAQCCALGGGWVLLGALVRGYLLLRG